MTEEQVEFGKRFNHVNLEVLITHSNAVKLEARYICLGFDEQFRLKIKFVDYQCISVFQIARTNTIDR